MVDRAQRQGLPTSAMTPPGYEIAWLRSLATGRRFPTVVFEGDTDMVTDGWTSLTSRVRTEVVVTRCHPDELLLRHALKARVNAALGRTDLEFLPLLRVEEGAVSGGLSFKQFRQRHRKPALFYRDLDVADGEAEQVETVSVETFRSAGGSIIELPGNPPAAPLGELLARKLAQLAPDPAQRASLEHLLGAASAGPEGDRVCLAILKLAGADMDRIASLAAAALEDYRDVLAWAEYPRQLGLPPGAGADELRAARLADAQEYGLWLLER